VVFSCRDESVASAAEDFGAVSGVCAGGVDVSVGGEEYDGEGCGGGGGGGGGGGSE
jgi:hypothetical protein